jgi:WhiB family redox-sensing transcriptional regulator
MSDVARLPAPRLEQWEWQLSAACRGLASAAFFHPDGERGASRVRRERAAKAICATCPVRQDCLDWALKVREPYGVWGGKTSEERALLIRRPPSITGRQFPATGSHQQNPPVT